MEGMDNGKVLCLWDCGVCAVCSLCFDVLYLWVVCVLCSICCMLCCYLVNILCVLCFVCCVSCAICDGCCVYFVCKCYTWCMMYLHVACFSYVFHVAYFMLYLCVLYG